MADIQNPHVNAPTAKAEGAKKYSHLTLVAEANRFGNDPVQQHEAFQTRMPQFADRWLS